MKIEFQAIGTIHTPYLPNLPIPNQPQKNAPGEFWITLKPEYLEGLDQLLTYRYITLIFFLDQSKDYNLKVTPPWAPEVEVGVFASRSPKRPNPIGISVVELKGIEGNEIIISGVDVYNGTPLLDIKPYSKSLDVIPDANDGWMDTLEDKDHRLAHLLGHDHHHPHGHDHHHGHSHSHDHHHDHSHHSHDHHHDHSHHSHSHPHTHEHSHSHTHGHDHSHDHSHQHTHTHEHSHEHDHGHHHHHDHDHLHSHEHDHDHDHEHHHDHHHNHNHDH